MGHEDVSRGSCRPIKRQILWLASGHGLDSETAETKACQDLKSNHVCIIMQVREVSAQNSNTLHTIETMYGSLLERIQKGDVRESATSVTLIIIGSWSTGSGSVPSLLDNDINYQFG